MTDSLRERIIRLAYERADLRPHLMPIVREATEFPTQDALNKYLKEHPDADKSKHTVKKQEKEDGAEEAPKKLDAIRAHGKKMMDVLKDLDSKAWEYGEDLEKAIEITNKGSFPSQKQYRAALDDVDMALEVVKENEDEKSAKHLTKLRDLLAQGLLEDRPENKNYLRKR